MKIKQTFLAVAGMVLLASVNVQAAQLNRDIGRYVYTCDDNKTLEVVYVNSGKQSYAIINQMDEMVLLKQVKSASGAIYKALSSNYTYELLTKGDTATLVEGDDKPILSNCRL